MSEFPSRLLYMPVYPINVIHNFILPNYLKNSKKLLDIWRGVVRYYVVPPCGTFIRLTSYIFSHTINRKAPIFRRHLAERLQLDLKVELFYFSILFKSLRYKAASPGGT